jgi:tetratricopeptide (TPR) repeat protein
VKRRIVKISETQALLNLLVDAIANARILLLVNYRPEYHHEWGNRMYYNQLRLDPLGREKAEAMLDAFLTKLPAASSGPLARSVAGEDKRGDEPRGGEGADLTALKRLIIERTEGNPFFMEETVQALFDDGALVRNGQVKLTKPLGDLKIPLTVQAMLSARIDRLPPAEKELLQTLAVVGKELPLELIKGVTGKREEQLEPMLTNLQLGEFIYEQPTIAGLEYTFKHALTQEVAYNSLLTQRRRMIHEQIARSMEELYSGYLEDHYSELAHHHLRGNDPAKAVHYAQLAAEQAVLRGIYADAIGLVRAALKLLEKMPENNERIRAELGLRSIESTVARVSQGLGSHENERVIRRMCELGERIGEKEQILRGLLAVSGLHFMRGESVRGLQVAKLCVNLAESVQDARLLADAHWRAGVLAQHCGKLREAVTHIEDAIHYSKRASSSVSTQGLSFSVFPTGLVMTLQLLGQVGKAIEKMEEGLRHARQSGRLYDLGFVLTVPGGIVHRYRREPEILRLYAKEAIALCEENGFVEWLSLGRFCLGWALAELGQLEQGIRQMEAGITGSRTIGGHPMQQYAIALLAQAYAETSRTDEALTMLNEALAHIERTGEKVYHAEMLRLKGETLLMHDHGAREQAEDCFRDALEVASMQEARWWELRTTVSLARLLRDTGRRNEAHSMLADIYNWFTEGFDTADLKDAKALLDELASYTRVESMHCAKCGAVQRLSCFGPARRDCWPVIYNPTRPVE